MILYGEVDSDNASEVAGRLREESDRECLGAQRGLRSMAGKIVEWGLRLLLAVILALAGAAKAFQPETFAIEVDRFQLTPGGSVGSRLFSAVAGNRDGPRVVSEQILPGCSALRLRCWV